MKARHPLRGDGLPGAQRGIRIRVGLAQAATCTTPVAHDLHDAHAPGPEHAFALSRLADPTSLDGTVIGILRQTTRPSYDQQLTAQLTQATTARGHGELTTLLTGNDTWQVPQR